MSGPSTGTSTAALAAAVEQHRAGRLDAALAFYQAALANEPQRFECLYFFGLLRIQRAEFDEAVALISQAVEASPDNGEARYNLAVALKGVGRLAEAIEQYRFAVMLRPTDMVARLNLGSALFASGESQSALEFFESVLAVRPDWAEAHYNRGAVLLAMERLPEAVAAFRSAIGIDPRKAKSHNNLGIALRRLGREGEAYLAFEAAIACDPNDASAQANLSAVLLTAGRVDEAITAAGRAVTADPTFASGYYNLGSALLASGDFAAAEEALSESLHLDAENAEAWNNLGNARAESGRIDDAIEAYRTATDLHSAYVVAWANLGRALVRQPDPAAAADAFRMALAVEPENAAVHADLGTALLAAGDFPQGWAEFEWRLEDPAYADSFPVLPKARWAGEAGDGTLLIYAEGGIGDIVQLLPLAGRARALGWRTVMAVPRHLIALLRGADGLDDVIDQARPFPPYDRFVASESLPAVLGLTLDHLPLATEYLKPVPARARHWEWRLKELAGARPKVGLVWAGNPTWPLDRFRSPGLWPLLPLLDTARAAGIALFALQLGPARAQIAEHKAADRLIDLGSDLTDLAETAAVMAGLDLVISSCTGPAHVAAALGKPVWTLLSHAACWRWMEEQTDTPWYPTMELFRAPAPGDWATPVDAIVKRLRAGPPY